MSSEAVTVEEATTTTSTTITKSSNRDLVITRIIDAPREKVFRAWTEPALMKQWFAPLPWTTTAAETDVRVGGSSLVVMRGPDGNEFPCPGVYLEVVRNERLVFTPRAPLDGRRPRSPRKDGVPSWLEPVHGSARSARCEALRREEHET
jgi:uncharacterized protein YndB with AHSA1/START domain